MTSKKIAAALTVKMITPDTKMNAFVMFNNLQ